MLNVQCTITTYIAIPKVKKEVYNEKLQLRKTKAKIATMLNKENKSKNTMLNKENKSKNI